MATVLFILSSVLFIVTFGVHLLIKTSNPLLHPMYIRHPFLSIVPAISAFILSTIALIHVINIHWSLVFLVNIAVVFLIGPWLTKGFLVRFVSGNGLGKDLVTAFVLAIVFYAIGFIIK